jgi:hypothetical protein
MALEAIRDRNHVVIGYTEEMPSSKRIRLLNRRFKTVGWFLPDRDVTTDASWRVMGQGNQLLLLLWAHSCT